MIDWTRTLLAVVAFAAIVLTLVMAAGAKLRHVKEVLLLGIRKEITTTPGLVSLGGVGLVVALCLTMILMQEATDLLSRIFALPPASETLPPWLAIAAPVIALLGNFMLVGLTHRWSVGSSHQQPREVSKLPEPTLMEGFLRLFKGQSEAVKNDESE